MRIGQILPSCKLKYKFRHIFDKIVKNMTISAEGCKKGGHSVQILQNKIVVNYPKGSQSLGKPNINGSMGGVRFKLKKGLMIVAMHYRQHFSIKVC